ncbi:hypothetical protein HC928_19240 [bacterium]|nr:hypothetical protein [bacterium]
MPDSSYVQSPIALEPFDKPDGANVALLVKKLSQAIANRAESDDLLRMVTALIGEAFAADGCLLEAPFQEEPAHFLKNFMPNGLVRRYLSGQVHSIPD